MEHIPPVDIIPSPPADPAPVCSAARDHFHKNHPKAGQSHGQLSAKARDGSERAQTDAAGVPSATAPVPRCLAKSVLGPPLPRLRRCLPCRSVAPQPLAGPFARESEAASDAFPPSGPSPKEIAADELQSLHVEAGEPPRHNPALFITRRSAGCLNP